MTVTLDDTGCTDEGSPGLPEGSVEFQMVNDTTAQFVLHVWQLADGHEYEELAAHIAEEQRRAREDEPGLGHPEFATLVAEGEAEAASEGSVSAQLAAGTFGFACISFVDGVPVDIWAAGPITIGQLD